MLKDNKLPRLNLPAYAHNMKWEGDKLVIFDELRKRFVKLTPEEWVRQNFVKFLMEELKYPKGKLGNEIEIKVNNIQRRCDTVIFGKTSDAIGIVELKAPHIKINQQVFDQIFTYNIKMQVPYLFISNGMQHFACKIENARPVFLKEIPFYESLIQ